MVAEFDNFAVVVCELCEGFAERVEFVVGRGVRSIGGRGIEIVVDFDAIAQDSSGASGFAGEVANAVHRDSEEPGFELALFAIFVGAEFGAQRGEDALGDVFGNVSVAAAALGHREHTRGVEADEVSPCGLIAGGGALEQVGDAGMMCGVCGIMCRIWRRVRRVIVGV